MKHNFFLFLLIFFQFQVRSQIKSPKEFLGYELGSEFSLHYQIVDYFKHLESNSSKIKLVTYGKTNEGRLLQLAFISTEQNIKNLEEIRINHLSNSGSNEGKKNENKSIVWLSYNVHGNESSSSEASLKTAYSLLTKHQDWLKDTIVIIDPCVNPDGRDRYVTFFKQNRSIPYDNNRDSREHTEPWHSGRTNHYIFDLNRDWAWLTQIESQNRIVQYNRWLPHIHVDFHEQGINSPYYFAPAAKPYHEIITDFQIDFQDTLGKNHAKYFDKNGWFYFTKQRFDLLYPSYGDTYPMFLGSIGMTYEQAGGGIAGLGVKNDENLVLTLKDRIEHHYTTGISTVEMASKNRIQLNKNYQTFFSDKNLKYKNFVLEGDIYKINDLKDFLNKHQIKSSYLKSEEIIRGIDFKDQKNTKLSFKKNSLVIPTNQVKGKMVQVLFEPKTKLSDSLTYDITAWSLVYAYGLKGIATKENINTVDVITEKQKQVLIDEDAYGYAITYKSFDDSKFLAGLLKENINVRYNTKPIKNSGKNWDEGTLFILKGDNRSNEDFADKLSALVIKHNKTIHKISTGYSDEGPDLGADELKFIYPPKIAIYRSDDTSPYNYGEVWHFFEKQIEYPLIQVNEKKLIKILPKVDLLIIPDGNYNKWSEFNNSDVIEEWLNKGGKIIALSSALNLFTKSEIFSLRKKEKDKQDTSVTPYADLEKKQISEITTGSIFEAKLDKTDPLSFGINTYYTLKLDPDSYDLLENGGNTFLLDEKASPISGFIGHLAKENQKKSLLFGYENFGYGKVIYFVDNPLFRGFWYNGKQIFSNALFF